MSLEFTVRTPVFHIHISGDRGSDIDCIICARWPRSLAIALIAPLLVTHAGAFSRIIHHLRAASFIHYDGTSNLPPSVCREHDHRLNSSEKSGAHFAAFFVKQVSGYHAVSEQCIIAPVKRACMIFMFSEKQE